MLLDSGELRSDLLRVPEAEIDRLLDEDVPFGDMTVRVLGIGEIPGRMTFAARQDLILCGSDEASRLLTRLGATVSFAARDGKRSRKGELLLEAEGPASVLHAGWKAAQTLMEWASGIATLTHQIVTAARANVPDIAVLCTRKAVPFTRRLSAKAVIAGGGEIHRLGLSDTIMMFEEHRAFLPQGGGLKAFISKLRQRAPERAIMIEVTSEADAFEAADAMADVIQLEKFEPHAVAHVVQRIQKRTDGRPVISVAGGVNAHNAGDYAIAGADALVTSAPYYARPVDIQVHINPA